VSEYQEIDRVLLNNIIKRKCIATSILLLILTCTFIYNYYTVSGSIFHAIQRLVHSLFLSLSFSSLIKNCVHVAKEKNCKSKILPCVRVKDYIPFTFSFCKIIFACFYHTDATAHTRNIYK